MKNYRITGEDKLFLTKTEIQLKSEGKTWWCSSYYPEEKGPRNSVLLYKWRETLRISKTWI